VSLTQTQKEGMNNGREITKNYKHEWVHKLANGTQRSFFEESYMKKPKSVMHGTEYCTSGEQ